EEGTGMVGLAGLANAGRGVGKKLGAVRVTMAGAGGAGRAVLNLLLALGATDVIVCDEVGAVHKGRPGLTDSLRWVAERTNADEYDGDLAGAVRGADVFIGVSAPNILTGDDIATMA